MADDVMAGLFGEDDPDAAVGATSYEQDGPDLFGMQADELILPGEPTPVDDPEMEIDLEQMDAIPIDPDEIVPGKGDREPPSSPVPAESRPVPESQDSAGRRPEAPLALYRRYRPDTFDEVIGEEHVTEPLQRALLNNRVNHAYLFSGPRGCGKTTSARILARCLNCEQGPTPTPCGVCQSCRDLARGGSGSIDVIEIDAASHGGVDEARDLRERAFFAPVHSRYKIYIIDEAHMVTNAGFNALLKVVEEPPPHVKFIFATTEPEKVIGTIRSRTHHYPFRLVPPRTLTAYLARLCEAEGVDVDHVVLPLVVRAGAGSVRDSLSVLDQLLGGAGGGGVTYQQAASLLGYTPESLLDEIVDAFAAGDAQGVFACIDKVIEVGQDPRRFGEDLLRRLRDLIIVAAVPDALETGLVDVAADQAERLTTQAAGMGAGELTRAAEVIAQGLTDMRGTTAPRLHLELMCARVLLPGADVDARGVHARLDRLERRLQMAPGEAADAARQQDAPRQQHATRQRPEPSQRPAEEPRSQRRVPEKEDQPVEPSPDRQRPAGPSTDRQRTLGQPGVRERPDAQRPERAKRPSSPQPAAGHETRSESAGWSVNVGGQQVRRVEPEQTQQAPVADEPPGGDPAQLGTAEVRARWPEVLDEVRKRRRVTWIILRENTQVHAFEGGVLTLTVNNPGAMESLARGGSETVREAVLAVFGVAVSVTVLPGGSEQASVPEPTPPGPGLPRADPEPQHSIVEDAAPRHAERARANIQPTRVGPAEEPETIESMDDITLDDAPLGSGELLAQVLGAELIGEEDPEQT